MKIIKRFMQILVCTFLLSSVFYYANGSAAATTENYIVIEKGDTLYSISKEYNVSIEKLKDYNHLTSNTIYVGQKLYIPSLEVESLYVVNAGSFTKKKNADKRVSFLKKKKIEALVVKKVINDKNYYRVQAGVFSSKSNAEKMRKKLTKLGIKDAYILTEKPLHINEITVESTYNQLVQQFGKPVKTEDQYNIRSLYFMNEGAGVRVTFNMSDGTIFQLQVFPEFLNTTSIPLEKADVLDVYGNPNEVKIVSCYESASCEQLIYEFNKSQLFIQIDRDGKTVQYLDLRVRKEK